MNFEKIKLPKSCFTLKEIFSCIRKYDWAIIEKVYHNEDDNQEWFYT